MKEKTLQRWRTLLGGGGIGIFVLYLLTFLFPTLSDKFKQLWEFRGVAAASEEAIILTQEVLPAVI